MDGWDDGAQRRRHPGSLIGVGVAGGCVSSISVTRAPAARLTDQPRKLGDEVVSGPERASPLVPSDGVAETGTALTGRTSSGFQNSRGAWRTTVTPGSVFCGIETVMGPLPADSTQGPSHSTPGSKMDPLTRTRTL